MTARALVLPDRAAWLAARREGIGGSDAAAALGLSPYRTPLELYAEKRGLLEANVESEAMRWGRILEPAVADRYVEETQRTLGPAAPFTILVHPERPYLRATLDREILAADGKVVPAVLEVKTTNAFRADDWLEEPPPHVLIQGQHQLLVTGRAWVSFAVLIGGQTFRWADCDRNDAFIAALQERLAAFWRRVELHDPPPPVAEDRDVLALLYPKEDPERIVDLPAIASTWDSDRDVALAELKKWQRVRDTAEAQIKAAMGEAESGYLPDGGRYTWRTVTREEYVAPATRYRQLRRLKT